MTFIEAPEPLLSYATNEATAKAIHTIINSGAVPDDLSIADYGKWCKARLVADTVKAQQAAFTHEVWMATWDECLKVSGMGVGVRDWMTAWDTVKPGVDAWNNGRFAARLTVDDRQFDFTACLDLRVRHTLGAVQLGFWVVSDEGCYNLSNTLPLAPPWMPPRNDMRMTSATLRVRSEVKGVDVSTLVTAAKAALAAISPG